MSADKLIEDVQLFFQTIREYPMSKIKTKVLIHKIDELCKQYPELASKPNSSENLSATSDLLISNRDQTSIIQSKKKPSETSTVNKTDNRYVHKSDLPSENENNVSESASNQLPLTVRFKEGDLILKKGSTILSSFSKVDEPEAIFYCILSCSWPKNRKIVYFTVYNDQRSFNQLKQYKIDDTHAFVKTGKRTFDFKYDSDVGHFEVEDGLATTWISSLKQIFQLRNSNEFEEFVAKSDDVSELLSDVLSATSEQSSPEVTDVFPPENIYVCLYNHKSTTKQPYELEFKCGDLLYIINNDGLNFYVGYKLHLPWYKNKKPRIGLVFKEYITPAYEKLV